jgi:hypothetical protein
VANQSSITASDRIAVAGVSFFAALITAAAIIIVAVLAGGDYSIIVASSPWAVGVAIVAAAVGYIAGPERAAAWWGVIWGTEDAEKHRAFSVTIALLVIAVCLWTLLR